MLFFNASLLIAIVASFVVGMIGYIIVWFWIKPIVRYHTTKRRIFRSLSNYMDACTKMGEIEKKKVGQKLNPLLKEARKRAMRLTNCYNDEIPYWYRLLLDSRQESPNEALRLITHLSKLDNLDRIRTQIDKTKSKLGLK